MANIQVPNCDNCGNNAAHPPHTTINGQVNNKPWCVDCIRERFNLARDDEKKFPLMINGESQQPDLAAYAGIFSDDYAARWYGAVKKWGIFVERRLHCNCAAGTYIYHFSPDKPLGFKGWCTTCSKVFCLRCGDEWGLTWGSINVHGQRGYCQTVVENKDWQRQQQYLGTRGEDHQLCPRCHTYTEEKADDSLASCTGCGVTFCFECGLQRGENPGLESEMCAGFESD